MRFYGFSAPEIGEGASNGMLDLAVDPKLAWALNKREQFPVDVNRAPREMLLRVPGLGVKTVDKLISSRRARRLRCQDLGQLRVPLKKVLPFVELADHRPRREPDTAALHAALRPAPQQADLFAV